MGQLVLKQEILDKINDDPILFGKIADVLGLKIRTMFNIMASNPPRLTEAGVLKILREHLKVDSDQEFLTEAPATAENLG